MEKHFKIIIAGAVVVISLSIFYSLIIRPIQQDKPLKECLKIAESVYESRDWDNPIKAFADHEDMKEDCYRRF